MCKTHFFSYLKSCLCYYVQDCRHEVFLIKHLQCLYIILYKYSNTLYYLFVFIMYKTM